VVASATAEDVAAVTVAVAVDLLPVADVVASAATVEDAAVVAVASATAADEEEVVVRPAVDVVLPAVELVADVEVLVVERMSCNSSHCISSLMSQQQGHR
jgi:hypothetical protein